MFRIIVHRVASGSGVGQSFAYKQGGRGGGSWHKASVSDCLPLAAPIGLSPLLILTLCGPERVLVVSTKPLEGGGGGWPLFGPGHPRPKKIVLQGTMKS